MELVSLEDGRDALTLFDCEHVMQEPQEAAWFQNEIKGCKSLLEIGSYSGGSLITWAQALAPGALIRSIDHGRPDDSADSLPALRLAIARLGSAGFDAGLCISSSRAFAAIDWARRWAPYDMVFIDGDHNYPGVRGDFDCYGPMGKRVALHDIGEPIAYSEGRSGACPDVIRLWFELKAYYPTKEFAVSGMGIGIVTFAA